MRIFQGPKTVVRLPGLPRRVTIMAIAALLSLTIGVLGPVYLTDLSKRTAARSVEQASNLAQLSGVYDLEGRRAAAETEALMLAGFERATAEMPIPSRVWLVMTPPPQEPVATLDLSAASVLERLQFVHWVLTCPPEKVFALRDSHRPGMENIRAFTSFGIWQSFLHAVIFRFFVIISAAAVFLTLVFRFTLRRFVLQSMDDLFIQLYGAAALSASNLHDDEAIGNLQLRLERFQERMRRHADEQARLASLGAGASFLAHDMRNLLASLQLNAEQLERMPGEKEKRIGQRLSAAIEQALSLAEWATLYTSHKRENLSVSRQKLEPMIAEVLNFARLHDPKQQVELMNECDADADVVAEPTLMFRVIYNLVLNAMQSMKGQSGRRRVLIEARSDAKACTIYVSDNGPGLPNGQVGMLLMPHMSGFGRPDGTGLGLKIVVDLLNWHGGKIEVARSDSHGTHFKITIPHESENAPRDEEMEAAPAALDAVEAEG